MNDPSTLSGPSLPSGLKRLEFILLACLCLLLCFLAWPGMTAPRIGDDTETLTHVTSFQSWKDAFKPDCYGVFRPVKCLLFYYLNLNGMPSIQGWHAMNLAAYLAATLGIHFLFRRLTGSWVWGLAATALWATCATQASTAIWMSCINISVAILFASPAVIFHDRSWSGATGKNVALSLAFLALALASYETALCIAPACLLVDVFRGRKIFSKPAMLRYLAIGSVAAAYLAIRASLGAAHEVHATNGGFDPAMPTWQLVVSAPWLLWRHFSMWLMPLGRVEFSSTYVWGHSAPMWEIAAAWGFLLALIATIFTTRKRLPLVSLGLAWYLVASFPTSNFIPIWAGPVADYYLVFPSVGLALALTGALRALVEWPRVSATSTSFRPSAAAVFSIVTFLVLWRSAAMIQFPYQAALWTSPLKLSTSIMETRPYQFMSKTMVARELMIGGDLTTAKKLALESVKEGPWQIATYAVLGEIAMREKQDDLAISYFDQILSRAPDGVHLQFAKLRKADILKNRPDTRPQARELLLPILTNPKSTYHYDATLVLANIYLAEGNADKALRTLEKSLALHPLKTGELQAAIRSIPPPAKSPGEPGPPAGN